MVHVMMEALLFTLPINNYVKAFNLAFHQVMNGTIRGIRAVFTFVDFQWQHGEKRGIMKSLNGRL